MTSTSVKDVGSVLNTLGLAAGTGAKAVGSGGFQMVFNGQTGKGASESQTGNAQIKVKKSPGDSLKAKDQHMARVSEKQSAKATEGASEDGEEITDEKLEQIMEVLGTAAADMIQQIADIFGVSVEELQGAMDELCMDQLDTLNQELLGALLLRMAGAEDAYALVTDGELYDSYQKLVAQLEDLMGEASEQLTLSPGQLEEAMKQWKESETPEEAVQSIPVELETVPEEKADRPDTERGILEDGELFQQMTDQEKPEALHEDMDRQSGSRERHSEGREHHGMFAQNFRPDSFQNQFNPQLQQTSAASQSWGTDTQNIMRQIMDYMRVQVKADTSSLEMQLHPESLGTLHIQVAAKGGVLTANFITQNEAVKTALESQIVQLRESFEEQGVKVEAIEVTVQSHAFERNLDQGRGQSSSEQGQSDGKTRTRTRRINLSDPLETENLEEEDALAAEIMAASGSQVDYTA